MSTPTSTQIERLPADWPDHVDAHDVRDGIHYPSSDGEPVGENDWHFEAIATLRAMLRARYEDRDDVYIASDLMFYYEQGNPRAVRAPDCMVVFGVSPHKRYSWMTWEENALPAIVFEFASKRTVREDVGANRSVYDALGIPEYLLFDPTEARFDGRRLLGYRLVEGAYREIEPEEDGGLISEQLGVKLYHEGEILRLTDLRTYRPLLTAEEISALLKRMRRYALLQQTLARKARRRARKALRAERAKAEAERQKAESERAKAEAERQKAESERLRADALAAEIERLKALLGDTEAGR